MAHLLPSAGIKNYKNEAFMLNKVYSSDFFKRNQEGKIPPNIHDYRWTDYREVDRRCQKVAANIKSEQRRKSNSMSIPRSQFNPAGPCPATVGEQFLIPPCPCPEQRGVGYKGGRDCACMADRPVDGSWGTNMGSHGPQGGYHTSGYSTTAGQSGGFGNFGNIGGFDRLTATAGQSQYSGNIGSHPHQGAYHPPAYCPPIGIDPRCLVRPRNKALDKSLRPTGAPYFAQESKQSCPEPKDAPVLHRSSFTFDDWLRTENQRQPPVSLRDAFMHLQSNGSRSHSVNSYPTAFMVIPQQAGYCY